MTSTDIYKLEKLLDKEADERAQDQGGYPDIIAVIGGHLVIAGEDSDNGCHLEWWSPSLASKWYREAVAMKKGLKCDWATALWESRPSPTGKYGH